MSTPAHHDLVHLVALIEAAKAHATRLGSGAGVILDELEQALLAARALESHAGKADEGLRPQELTTDNDE